MLAGTVAQPKSKRRSRKRHTPRTAPRASAAQHHNPPRSARQAMRTGGQRNPSPLKTFGDPPPNRFGGVPVAEIAILAGAIGFVVGLVNSSPVVAIVGMVVCALGVLEFSVREHFSGYRSHTLMLAAFPAVIIEVLLIVLIQPKHPILVLLPVIPIYVVAFMLLRRRFTAARQLRIARPPAP
jgi:Flp pilus assembly protein TadB